MRAGCASARVCFTAARVGSYVVLLVRCARVEPGRVACCVSRVVSPVCVRVAVRAGCARVRARAVVFLLFIIFALRVRVRMRVRVRARVRVLGVAALARVLRVCGCCGGCVGTELQRGFARVLFRSTPVSLMSCPVMFSCTCARAPRL